MESGRGVGEEKEEGERERRAEGRRLQGLRRRDCTERPICIANWQSIYGHRRTVNRASLELKLITFMSGAMYHYARIPHQEDTHHETPSRLQLPRVNVQRRSCGREYAHKAQ